MKTKDIKKKVAAKVEKAKSKVAAKCGKAAKCAALLAAVLVGASGCVNGYTRAPWTDNEITDVYQSTKTSAATAYIVAFPQMMSAGPSDYVLQWENIVTVPLGLVVACDAVAEAVVDTICLPADWAISNHRKAKGERHAE